MNLSSIGGNTEPAPNFTEKAKCVALAHLTLSNCMEFHYILMYSNRNPEGHSKDKHLNLLAKMKDRNLYFPLTCFDAMCTSSASCAERTPPAGDGRHGSVGVAIDPAGITITGRSHRVAVGGVGQTRGVGQPRTQELGASHPIRAQTGRGKVQRS